MNFFLIGYNMTLHECSLIILSLTSLSSGFDGFSGRISEPADLGARIDKDLFPEGSVGDQDLLVQVRIVEQSFGL
jgi:hypothetical protein